MIASEASLYKFLKDVQTNVDKDNKNKMSKIAHDRKNVLNLKILVGLDCSGSIGHEQFLQFMAQVNKMRGVSTVIVIEIDTTIVAMYNYYTNSNNEVVRVRGGGGTEFLEFFEAAKKMNPDAIVFLTDGDVADDVKDPGIPTGWILTHNGKPPYKFGEVLFHLPE